MTAAMQQTDAAIRPCRDLGEYDDETKQQLWMSSVFWNDGGGGTSCNQGIELTELAALHMFDGSCAACREDPHAEDNSRTANPVCHQNNVGGTVGTTSLSAMLMWAYYSTVASKILHHQQKGIAAHQELICCCR